MICKRIHTPVASKGHITRIQGNLLESLQLWCVYLMAFCPLAMRSLPEMTSWADIPQLVTPCYSIL